MPVIILKALHTVTHLILTTFLIIIIPIFQKRKLRLRMPKFTQLVSDRARFELK